VTDGQTDERTDHTITSVATAGS